MSTRNRPVMTFFIRVIRKLAFITKRITRKAFYFSSRVEDKATRMLTGSDFSRPLVGTMSFEEVFYNGIPYNLAPLNPALPALGREGKVTLLIPSLQNSSFFGGTATALIIAGQLAMKLGQGLRIVETLSSGGKTGLGKFFASNNIDIRESDVELLDVSGRRFNVYGYLDMHPDDTYIASAWWDAYLLNMLPLSRKFIYLIQDYEPIFYPNGDRFVLAESTYHSDKFIPLCNTELMYKFMVSKGYDSIKKDGLWFEPAVSYRAHGLSHENKGKKRIFLYGRPQVERNLYYSGLLALNQAFAENELNPTEWEVYMAGQDNMPSVRLSSGVLVENLGKMPMNEYIEFTRTVDLAISLMMAPHPNYPTLEFASVGASVVTTRYETKDDLSSYSKNIYMSDTHPDSIGQVIIKASKVPYATRIKNAESNNINESWGEALNEPLGKIVRRLKSAG